MKITVENEVTLTVRDGNRVTVENVGNNTIVIVLEVKNENEPQLWDSQRFTSCQQTKSLDNF